MISHLKALIEYYHLLKGQTYSLDDNEDIIKKPSRTMNCLSAWVYAETAVTNTLMIHIRLKNVGAGCTESTSLQNL